MRTMDYFIKSDKYKKELEESGITKPKKREWEIIKKNMENIIKKLLEIKNKQNFDEIKKIINKYKIEINDYIENSEYNSYLTLKEELNSVIKQLNFLKDLKIEENNNCNYNKYEIEETNLQKINELIKILKNKCFDEIKVEKIDIDNNFDNYSLDDIKIKQYGNFIFNKNNEPHFLKKRMIINLGLYIFNSNIKEIGYMSIQNNFSKELKYLIKQNSNNYIIISNTNNKELTSLKDLEISFQLIKNNLSIGSHQSQFELILFDDKKEFDKCNIIAFIYVIPLIIHFSLQNEKFTLENKIISISHYIQNLKILYSFPGNYYPKNLRIKVDNKNDKINIDEKKEGLIDITLFKNYIMNINLNSRFLFKIKIEYDIPRYYGLIIFNEQKIKINSIKIIKNKTKDLFLFNMSGNKINLRFNYNKQAIKLKYSKDEIEPGKYIKLQIENIDIEKPIAIKIMNKDIIIEGIDFPKIDKNYECSKVIFKNNNPSDKTDSYDIQNLKVIFINKSFQLKNEDEDYDFFHFSTYLIFENKIIEESKNEYDFENPKENDNVFGFSNGIFGSFRYNNITIALGYKVENYKYYKSIFTNNQRTNYKKSIENNNFKEKIISMNIKDINEAISYLINKDINIEDENSIKKLQISEDKTSIINILIYLLQYSLNFKTSDELKEKIIQYFKRIYKFSNRKIQKFFIPNIQNEKLKTVLEKLSYIISFVLLCVSPGEIIEYEYIESQNIPNIDDNDNNINKKISLLEEQFNLYFKDLQNEKIVCKDIIYFNDNIFLHDENDEFSKYEKQIEENNNKIENYLEEEESDEFSKSCYNDIINIINDIKENKINILYLLFFLEKCKKCLMTMPFFLTKIKDENQLKDYIKGCLIIFNYVKKLEETNIINTKFGDIIINYMKEFDNFLSKHSYFKSSTISHINSDNNNSKDYQELKTTYNKIKKINRNEKININKNLFSNNLYSKEYNYETENIKNYESQKDTIYEEKKYKDKYRIQIIENLSPEAIKSIIKPISIEGTLENFNEPKIDEYQGNTILNDDLTDNKHEIF